MNHRRNNIYTPYDAVFTAKLDAWQFYGRGCREAFGRERASLLATRNGAFCADRRKVVFLTFENSFAPLGGLAAVMRYLPSVLKKSGEDVILLTPLYVNIPTVKAAVKNRELTLVKEFVVCTAAVADGGGGLASHSGHSGGHTAEMTVSCYRGADAPVSAYYIGIEGRFTAEQNPYSYNNADDLLDDSLAFCAAVPHVLKELGFGDSVLFHAHDWETAPVAVTSKLAVLDGALKSAHTVLTLHNSFDCGIGADKKRMYLGGFGAGDTVLQCAIPLLDGPLSTVSTPFASELVSDPLQRTIFTNHLQREFAANPPIGIENGMFGRPYLKYTHAALSWARQGDPSKLLEQKSRFRERMLAVAAGMDRPEVVGKLADVRPDTPVLFMSGRLDMMQKGFDVIFRALENIPPEKAGLIFCPSSADAKKHAAELAFFKSIADRRGGGVVIWPFRISSEDYVSVVLGSSFLLMPSFYEPFGAATEGFMHGTPVIARATGGLLTQVRPLADKPHRGVAEDATGILYREDDALSEGGWKEILGLPVADRAAVPLYKSMVLAAHAALTKAIDLFADRQAYGQMMLNGMDSLRSFSWDKAAGKYRRIYNSVSRAGEC